MHIYDYYITLSFELPYYSENFFIFLSSDPLRSIIVISISITDGTGDEAL